MDVNSLGVLELLGHSLSDWDYPAASILLSDVRYTSSPTSLRAWTDRALGYTWVFLKPALGACIPEGKLTTEWYRWGLGEPFPKLTFRAQGLPPGSGVPGNTPDNCYQVYFTLPGDRSVNVFIDRIVSAVRTNIHSWNGGSDWDRYYWYHIGIIWYNYTDEAGNPFMRIMVMREHLGAWYELTHYDEPNPFWSASPVNLLGLELFGWKTYDDYYDHIDDTKIYRRTP